MRMGLDSDALGGREVEKEEWTSGEELGGRNGGERKRVLIPLKTTLETRSSEKAVNVFVVACPMKAAHGVLSLIRKLVPDEGGMDIQHLRRFAKIDDVPSHVQKTFFTTLSKSTEILPNTSDLKLFLIIGPTTSTSLQELITTLSTTLPGPIIFTTKVPLLAPTSQAQATRLTSMYWPTVYKKNNPFGPHPAIISRAEAEMKGEAEEWMKLAWDVADESEKSGSGERIGVVIVERKEGRGRVVAVAGDGRWMGFGSGRKGGGNVTAHAVMRGIGMVAQGLRKRDEESRRGRGDSKGDQEDGDARVPPTTDEEMVEEIATTSEMKETGRDMPHEDGNMAQTISKQEHETEPNPPTTTPSLSTNSSIFHDTPALPLERTHFDPNANTNGYLCHDLEIYCTHEPCVMCSMAIVHSRLGRVVFQHRMRTGGMCADGELGHGLAWRKELNWTLLGWEWGFEGGGEGVGFGGLNA